MAPSTRFGTSRCGSKTAGVSERNTLKSTRKTATKHPRGIEKNRKSKESRNAAVSTNLNNVTESFTHQNQARFEKSYWLMKAEPESRFEKGIDVRFSIDDLAAATEPEGWDGVRNYVARNNMRAMNKGDLAFFYHSNCKAPGIVGVMEISREHSIDKSGSAHDPNHPYFDPKDDVANPKWSLVHVEFRRKFTRQISLKDLQKYKSVGQPLASMQLLRQSRLSVSKVSKEEWDFILELEKKLAQGEEG